jgi:hypothetical protein
MKTTCFIVACITIMFACVLSCDYTKTTSTVTDIRAKIDINNPKIIFKKDFSVDIIIQNNGSNKVNINVSPDEVITPPSETSGGSYRSRGSSCTLTVTQDQDKNSQFDFFCTSWSKIQPPGKSMNFISILPGKTHTISFTISPWGPIFSSLPSTAIPGPAEIHGNLQLIVNGHLYNVGLDSCKLNFVTE